LLRLSSQAFPIRDLRSLFVHLWSSAIATEVMAATPPPGVGSGRGSNLLSCGPGRGFPAASVANFSGPIAPGQNMAAGILCPPSPKTLLEMKSGANPPFKRRVNVETGEMTFVIRNC
jgi:hypothetical protein